MNGKRVLTDSELERQLGAYLHEITSVDPPPRVMEITAMSLHTTARARHLFSMIVTVVAITAAAITVALVAHATAPAPAHRPPVGLTPAPTSAPSATAAPSTATVRDAAGAFTVTYPAAWGVDGPCTLGAQMSGGSDSREVLVGPGAAGCGRSGGATGVEITSTPGSTESLLTPDLYPGCTLTNTTVHNADGLSGTRQAVTSCQGVAFVSYQFVSGGHVYVIGLDEIANPAIGETAFDSLVTGGIHLHA